MSATPFIVRLVHAKGRDVAATEFSIAGSSALVGRDAGCDVPLSDDASVSRRHLRIEWTGRGPFRLVDLGSVNGVWIGARRVSDEPIDAGQPFRVGDCVLECVAVPALADLTKTIVLSPVRPVPPKVERLRLDDAGEPFALDDRKATLLDDATCAYYVVSGKVEVFSVTIEDGRALEGRSHFATVEAGGLIFGIDPGQSHGSLLLATAAPGARVRRITCDELDALARHPQAAEEVAALVERWLMSAAARLAADLPARPEINVALQSAVPLSLAEGQRARASRGAMWIPIERDGLVFVGMKPLAPANAPTFIPLTPQIWIEPAPGRGPLLLEPRATGGLLAAGELWIGLRFFHDAMCACLAIVRRASVAEESARLGHKAREAAAAQASAFDALGAVFAEGVRDATTRGVSAGRLQPILEASRLVGRHLGLEVRTPVEIAGERRFEDHVAAIATASGFRTRVVALRAGWWTTDSGPLLGQTEQGAAVALVPSGSRAYVATDVTAGTEALVTGAYAETLAPFAFAFYRPLPSSTLGPLELMRFGARGVSRDVWMLVGISLLAGALGATIPLLTGQMIDRAIPQGERGLLLQLGLGMLLITLASTLLSIVKSVAMVRVESRMDYVLQSAVWARLLSLPTGFFRTYGAGDLAVRAGGIDAIRRVLSTSGIGAILGVINASAYLVLMLYLSVRLTLVAVAITVVLVAVSTLANYLMLRTQRQESEMRGQIASLMLQLISGVGKVRMSGAESHAFHVWARRFAEQKRLAVALGRLQNVLGTLTSGFQVLAPLVIFTAIYRLQPADASARAPLLTTGGFVAFYAAFGTFAGAIGELCSASLGLLSIVPFYERLAPILRAAPENDGANPPPGRLTGAIAVSRLHFRYRSDGPWVLKDVSFSIRPGEFVALVGPSGCGKSTLLRLLLGFERPTSGAVYYDGLDLAQLDAPALRQQLGVVLQESRLLPTDIFRNIVGDSSRGVNEAWEAAEQAGLADDIRQMPMGLHTTVSEGGGTFSGGQSQRLLIARALVAKPRIVLFDEATSALDNKAQAVVTESLERLEATRVVIAHRLSTLVDADRIIYIDGGQIQEEGTYAELMAKGGLFAQLAQRQMA